MPEMPEVEGLVRFLRTRAVGRRVVSARVTAFSALKTYDPPLEQIVEHEVTGAERRGKFVDLALGDDLHLVFHLAKAGWLRWSEKLPQTPVKPGRSPIALRVGFDDGSG